MKRLLLALLISAPAWCQPTLTTISDTLYRADGTKFRGTVSITWQAFNQGAIPVKAGYKEITVGSNGVFSVQLAPNVGATPAGTAYRVKYTLQLGQVREASWTVPASLTALNI